MASYNGDGKFGGKGTEGVQPTTVGNNREFWNDRFVEPKQQHRFSVQFPVYTPVGNDKDILWLANEIAKTAGNTLTSETTKRLKNSMSPAEWNGLTSAQRIELTEQKKDSVRRRWGRTRGDLKIGLGTGDNKYRTKYLYMRIPEYVAFSFKPPGFSFSPEVLGSDGEGFERQVPGSGKLQRTSAALTFVTTLRDDLNFSLNLLWNLGAPGSSTNEFDSTPNAETGRVPVQRGVKLFPDAITQLNDNEKYVVIYEYYARNVKAPVPALYGPGAVGSIVAAADADAIGKGGADRSLIGGIPAYTDTSNNNPYAIAGIHKLFDPIIESVDFGEFSYGGAELIKITVNLTYSDTPRNFYSYQNTESRYGEGTVYAMNEGEYHQGNRFHDLIYGPEGTPTAGTFREHITNARPNFATSGNQKTLLQLRKERHEARKVEDRIIGNAYVAPAPQQRGIIREIYRGDDIEEKNAVFSRSAIAKIIAENEAAAQAAMQAETIGPQSLPSTQEIDNRVEQTLGQRPGDLSAANELQNQAAQQDIYADLGSRGVAADQDPFAGGPATLPPQPVPDSQFDRAFYEDAEFGTASRPGDSWPGGGPDPRDRPVVTQESD